MNEIWCHARHSSCNPYPYKRCLRKTSRGDISSMIPEPSTAVNKGEVLKTKMSAHDLHKALSALLLSKVQADSKQDLEQMNRLLMEYAYRGSNIMYSEPAN
ncbi:unnamed protein product [Colias eurytheme]|nr:unnamed protein product [Colias eurytheme]